MAPIRRPLDEALQVEIGRLELLICHLWRLLGLMGCALGLALYAVAGLSMAAWCAAASLALFGWFTIEARLRTRGRVPRWAHAVNLLLESALPWAFLLIIALSQGAEYALGSWVPPMLFCALIVAATARLRPEAPILIALSGVLAFPALYFLVLRGALPLEALDKPLLSPMMQITRGVSLLLGGTFGFFVARGLRQAIAKADIAARQRDLFAKYRLERRIAAGGMGTVFEATYCPEGGFERRVAVKRIHPHLARTPRFLEAFRREAELSARLAHPNVVQVLDFGREGEAYFLAMEYVDGLTLVALLRRLHAAKIAIAPSVVAYVAREILAALAYSHGGARDADGTVLRIVHRDLSPANVLVSLSGDVKITDFGVARALRDAAAAVTRTVVGHVGYMAPEQARAEPVDERSDLFSLGVLLWEMLCGRPLFERGSEGPTLMALVSEPIPPPSGERPLDAAWDAFLGRALERDPEQRFPSAQAMARELALLGDARGGSLPGEVAGELALLVEQASLLPDRAELDEDAAEAVTRAAVTRVEHL